MIGTNVRFARKDPKGVHTCYVEGSRFDHRHTVKTFYPKRRRRGGRASRTWLCTCGDFIHRHSVYGGYCKHIRLIRNYVDQLLGFAYWPTGKELHLTEIDGKIVATPPTHEQEHEPVGSGPTE